MEQNFLKLKLYNMHLILEVFSQLEQLKKDKDF